MTALTDPGLLTDWPAPSPLAAVLQGEVLGVQTAPYGTALPGYLLTHGARLLVMAGDKQTVQSIADAYDNPASVPFYTADGVQHNVPVEVSFLPFQSASGTVVNLAVI